MDTSKNKSSANIGKFENNYIYFREMRELANNSVVRSASSLDNIIFVVTTGALVLSVNLFSNLEILNVNIAYVLLASWIALIITLILHTFSYIFSIRNNKKVIYDLDKWHNDGYSYQFKLSRVKRYKGRSLIDNLSYFFMILGILLVGIFVSLNFINNEILINNKNNMSIDNPNKNIPGEKVEKSADNVLREPPSSNKPSSNSEASSSENVNAEPKK